MCVPLPRESCSIRLSRFGDCERLTVPKTVIRARILLRDKAARQAAVDPRSGEYVALFIRGTTCGTTTSTDRVGAYQGRTAIGHATVEALEMDRPLIIAIGEEERARDRYPSPESAAPKQPKL